MLVAIKTVKYGTYRTSVLVKVPGFSVVNALPHILHVIFEGVVHYEFHYRTSKKFLLSKLLVIGSKDITSELKINLSLTQLHLTIPTKKFQ